MQGGITGRETGKPVKAYRNIRLLLAYDGAAFQGWQIQPDKTTVQGTILDALAQITGERVRLIGSGRTDAGTHARGLVANFVTASRIPTPAWAPALNRLLPAGVRVLSARRVPLQFHARRAARSKVYRYQIYRGSVVPPHLAREHFHYPYPLDVPLMERAAQSFLGEHDFAGFAAKNGRRGKTVRESLCLPTNPRGSAGLQEAGSGDPRIPHSPDDAAKALTVRRIFLSELKCKGRRLIFTVEGNGFLHHMVRNMIGTLLDVGRGRISLDRFRQIFERRDRTLAGFTAPAHALTLLRVRY